MQVFGKTFKGILLEMWDHLGHEIGGKRLNGTLCWLPDAEPFIVIECDAHGVLCRNEDPCIAAENYRCPSWA